MILFTLLNFSFATVGVNDITLEGFSLLTNKQELKVAFSKFIQAVETHEGGRMEDNKWEKPWNFNQRDNKLIKGQYNHDKKFPIEIVRTKGKYFYHAAKHDQDKISNRSHVFIPGNPEDKETKKNNIYGKDREQGTEQMFEEDHTLTKDLIKLLNSEKIISKIVITKHEKPKTRYTVTKFGMSHSIYRGVTNTQFMADDFLPPEEANRVGAQEERFEKATRKPLKK